MPKRDVEGHVGASAMQQPAPRKPTRKTFERIYGQIRERICLLKYPPGMLLRETELAGEFGVSRTPVREVLQRLKFEGLVETRNGVGTIVTGVDFRSFKEVYDFRMKLAELIGDMGHVRIGDEDVARVKSLIARAEKLKNSGDTTEFWRICHEQQQEVNQLIANEALRWAHDLFYFQTARIWFNLVDRMWDEEVEMLIAELHDVLRALRARDVKSIGYIHRNYISFGLRRISRYLTEDHASAGRAERMRV